MDRISRAERSAMMSRIRSKNTKPERAVRSCIHRLGFRFRLHDRSLPGAPDIVLPRFRAVIQVHGCFWHRHRGCRFAYNPKSRTEFWAEKFRSNVKRDRKDVASIRRLGWRVLTVWECQTKDLARVDKRVLRFLGSRKRISPDLPALSHVRKGGRLR